MLYNKLHMSIQDFADKIKGRGGRLALPLAILGVAGISFWLGYATKAEMAEASPVEIQCPLEAYMQNTPSSQAIPSATKGTLTTPVPSGSYVASKNGTKYYPPGCAGAKRILDANRVYFTSTVAAEKAGYTLAATCN